MATKEVAPMPAARKGRWVQYTRLCLPRRDPPFTPPFTPSSSLFIPFSLPRRKGDARSRAALIPLAPSPPLHQPAPAMMQCKRIAEVTDDDSVRRQWPMIQ